jgi:hypothetical protein
MTGDHPEPDDDFTEENLGEALEDLKRTAANGGVADEQLHAGPTLVDGELPFDALDLAPPPAEAEPTGVAFRGSQREDGATEISMPYTVNSRHEVWSDNAAELYERAKRKQWNATTDIPWGRAGTWIPSSRRPSHRC